MAGRHRFNARHDLADRMTSATVGVTSQTYTWSGDGVRLSAATGAGAATTSFFVDRAAALPQVALERDGTGTVLRDEVYGLGRISVVGASGGIAYEHTDALGSVTDLTGSTGVPLAWSEASPYGAIRSAGAAVGAPADPFGFTGQFQDSPTGLYYLRARQYDPSIGRFLSTDPQPGGMADPYVSAYGYVSGNPVRYTDPSGRESQAPAGTMGQTTGTCFAISAQVGLLGGLELCNISGHFQTQLKVGASTGVGASIGVTKVVADATSPSQLSGFGAGFGGSGGGGVVIGGDRCYALSGGRVINCVTGSTGVGLKISPEFATPVEGHAYGSYTVDFNDLLGSLFGFGQ